MTRVSVTDARLTARLYQETRERISKLVTGTDDAALSTAVAACPGWSGRDVVAHVAAVADDWAQTTEPKYGSALRDSRPCAGERDAAAAPSSPPWTGRATQLRYSVTCICSARPVPRGVGITGFADHVTRLDAPSFGELPQIDRQRDDSRRRKDDRRQHDERPRDPLLVERDVNRRPRRHRQRRTPGLGHQRDMTCRILAVGIDRAAAKPLDEYHQINNADAGPRQIGPAVS